MFASITDKGSLKGTPTPLPPAAKLPRVSPAGGIRARA